MIEKIIYTDHLGEILWEEDTTAKPPRGSFQIGDPISHGFGWYEVLDVCVQGVVEYVKLIKKSAETTK